MQASPNMQNMQSALATYLDGMRALHHVLKVADGAVGVWVLEQNAADILTTEGDQGRRVFGCLGGAVPL